MKKLLVAVDGSEESNKALKLATELASKLGASLTVLNVVLPPYVPPEPYGIATAGLEEAIRSYGEQIAKSAAETIRKAGVTAEWRVETGSPAEIIDQTAAAIGADMIVVGSRGQGAVRRALLGSVSTRLLHICERPVLVAR